MYKTKCQKCGGSGIQIVSKKSGSIRCSACKGSGGGSRPVPQRRADMSQLQL